MIKLKRNPEKIESINLFVSLAQKNKYKIGDQESIKDFVTRVGKSVSENMTETMIHGNRTESMFSYVVSSLNEVLIIKKEDSGDTFTNDENIKVPDYRIVTKDNVQFLVEVKNYCSPNLNAPYKMKKKYRDCLKKYSKIMSVDIYVAIYWSRFYSWTLISLDDFIDGKTHIEISFERANMKNNMYLLGDKMIGTKPNLVMKIVTDTTNIKDNGTYELMIKGIDFLCNDEIIKNKVEESIAFYLMKFGDWISENPRALIDNGHVTSIEYICHPQENYKDNYRKSGFVIIGTLSKMVSSYYTALTAPEGHVERIYPESESTNLGVTIPKDYKGDKLPLWIFTVLPNRD